MPQHTEDLMSPAEDYGKQLGNVLQVFLGGGAKLMAAMLIYSTRVPLKAFVEWLDALYSRFEYAILLC